MSFKTLISASVAVLAVTACSQVKAPAPMDVLPSKGQVEWQKMEMNMFVHFGPNTFTSREWGNGQENPDIFNPSDLDCRQWIRTAKAAGFKGVIITAKHHDGFCLWPNPVSNHTVAQSSWMDGKGDVLKSLSEACREYGLKFGIYISPWDRNDPHYGTPEYNEVFRQTLQSALSSYGDVFEQWFDGACGEGPNGKRQVYDWPLFHSEVYKHHPEAVIFSDIGPGCRWVGNEEGHAGETNWSTLDTIGFAPGHSPAFDTLGCGNAFGKVWVPAETDVSIRPGWFYKDSENDKVKSVNELLDIYYSSTGRNSLMLLNVPADTRGHIHEIDSVRLMEFRAAMDDIFSVDLAEGAKASATNVRGGSKKFEASNILDGNYDSYWAADDGITSASITFELKGEKKFNRVMLQEYIPLGQRISALSVEARIGGEWKTVAHATTVGYKRILLIEPVSADAVRVNIECAHACPTLNGFSLYMDNNYIGKVQKAEHEAEYVLEADAEGNFSPVVLDLEVEKEIKGFRYVPQYRGKGGVIIEYRAEVSTDGKAWKVITDKAMIDNIVNNPIERFEMFDNPVKAAYLRLTALRSSDDKVNTIYELEAIEN